MKTVLRVLLFILILLVFVTALLSFLGAFSIAVGAIGAAFAFVWQVILSPILLIAFIIWVIVKLSKKSSSK